MGKRIHHKHWHRKTKKKELRLIISNFEHPISRKLLRLGGWD